MKPTGTKTLICSAARGMATRQKSASAPKRPTPSHPGLPAPGLCEPSAVTGAPWTDTQLLNAELTGRLPPGASDRLGSAPRPTVRSLPMPPTAVAATPASDVAPKFSMVPARINMMSGPYEAAQISPIPKGRAPADMAADLTDLLEDPEEEEATSVAALDPQEEPET